MAAPSFTGGAEHGECPLRWPQTVAPPLDAWPATRPSSPRPTAFWVATRSTWRFQPFPDWRCSSEKTAGVGCHRHEPGHCRRLGTVSMQTRDVWLQAGQNEGAQPGRLARKAPPAPTGE